MIAGNTRAKKFVSMETDANTFAVCCTVIPLTAAALAVRNIGICEGVLDAA